MMENFFAWFEISESAAYVLTTFGFMVALIVAEIYGLKNRRSRAYQALCVKREQDAVKCI